MTIPTLNDIYAARPRVRAHVPTSPLMKHPLLDAASGLDIRVKHENHNPTGAFKVRGGINLVSTLTADERARGIVTASTGNHGQSIALAGRLHAGRRIGHRPVEGRARNEPSRMPEARPEAGYDCRPSPR